MSRAPHTAGNGGLARVGPFTLRAMLGAGAHGEVWHATHRDGVPVAIKVLARRHDLEPGFVDLFRREARSAARLAHPGIVEVLDLGDVTPAEARRSHFRSGTPWIAMSLAAHGSLLEHLPLIGWPQLRGVLEQLLGALAHAHAHGIVHRDLKPSNLLLDGPDDDMRVVIADFGLAAIGADDAPEADGSFVGTPPYTAPEQINGTRADQGPWTDLYAVGCIAFELVSGQPPFVGERDEVLASHATAEPPPLEARFAIPHELDDWIRWLLVKKPERRCRHAADALARLAALPGPATEPLRRVGPAIAGEQDTRTGSAAVGRLVPRLRSGEHRPVSPNPAALPSFSERFDPSGWRTRDERTGRPSLARATVGLATLGLRRPDLVGRHAERRALWAHLGEMLAANTPSAVILEGPPGVGASTLAEWLARAAAEQGLATPAVTSARSAEGVRALFAELLGASGLNHMQAYARAMRLLTRHYGVSGAALHWEAQALAELVAPRPRRAAASAESALVRPAEQRAVALSLIARMTARRPIVLVIDDADLSPDLVGLVAEALAADRGGAVLFVLTRRNANDAPAEGNLRVLAEHPRAHAIPIGVLDDATMGRAMVSLLPLSPATVDRLVAQAAGNPMFAVQLVGEAAARRQLRSADVGFHLDADASLPADTTELWQRRLEAVGGAHPTVVIGALLGDQVDRAEWLAACRAAGYALDGSGLHALAAAGLVIEYDAGWRFAHAGLARAVRDAASPGQRHAGHRACAAALVECYGHDEARATRRAAHLAAAEATDEAIDAFNDAIHHQLATDHYDLAERLLADLSALSEGLADEPRRYRHWEWYATLARRRGDRDGALAWGDRLIAAAERLADDGLAAQGWFCRGHAELDLGRFADSDRSFARAVTHAPAEPRIQPIALQGRAYANLFLGRLQDARDLFREALQAFPGEAGVLARGFSARGLAQALHQLGDREGSREALEQAVTLFTEAMSRSGLAHCRTGLADLARAEGRLDDAEALYLLAREDWRVLGNTMRSVSEANLGIVALLRGDPAAAEAHFRAMDEQKSRLILVIQTFGLVGALAGRDPDEWDAACQRLDELLADEPMFDRDNLLLAEQAVNAWEQAGDRGRAARARAVADAQRAGLGHTEPSAPPRR